MRALLLADSPPPLLRACDLAGAQRVLVPSVAEGRRKLALERFDVVDGRIARPASLELEIRNRLELFYEQLQGHSVSGLYDAVMREVEKPLLSAALARARGIRSDAARDLGIDRGTLARRIRALGLGRRR